MTNQKLTRTFAFIVVAILVISQYAYTQAPDTLWTKILERNGEEYFTSIEMTSNGGFILGGFTTLSESTDYWLVNLDNNGDINWEMVYPTEYKYDSQNAIQTSDCPQRFPNVGTDLRSNLCSTQPLADLSF